MEKEFRIIPSVREIRYLNYALSLKNEYIQPSGSHIGNLQQWTDRCHKAGKKVLINHELVGGLGNDKIAFQMLKQLYHVDALIGSSVTKLHMMKNLKLKIIYRITLIDSISVQNALRFMREVKFDAVELRPYYHAVEFLPKFQEVWQGDYYAAGFVNTEEKVRLCKESGFRGVMTSTRELWSLRV
ncbi:MAG: glycerol-3-phosphate responsive antiterminator [Eubacteriales bacterium]|nr:glycerol-3-phosphate responsive antiterminator [Eubacteriales bacterium]